VEKREGYCCFSSPLSRIIQEQVRPQLALTWGSAQSPSCTGLSLDQIARVDWRTVNLDEWIGILNLAGKLPNAANLNLDRVTGSGNWLNINGNRPDAQTRAVQRIDGLDTTGARINAGQQLR
jgi:conjugal transfer mating pair stabilization protein TraN